MQVKAFLRNEPLPFTAGQLEGMSSMVNMNTRIAKKLFSSSLRYWMLEYMRRQPKERRFAALILRFIKDRIAALFLIEVLHQMPLVPYKIKITTSFPSNIVSRFGPYYLTCILRTLGFYYITGRTTFFCMGFSRKTNRRWSWRKGWRISSSRWYPFT